jgi:hypothetical protein
MIGGWFFELGGVILIVSGVLQTLVRPRKPKEHRWINRGTIWAAVCVLVGLGAILMGAGILPVGHR